MPRYNYFCQECDDYFELSHSMTDLIEVCIACESPDFRRVPCVPTYIQKQKSGSERKVGSLVEEYIEKNRKSVQDEKKNLKNQEFKK